MKRKVIAAAAAAVLSASMALTSYAAGWDRDEKGYWYLFDNGAYARNQIVNIDGVNYAFDQNAYMVEGWYNSNSNWYYFSPGSGAQVLGWLNLNGTWYYLDPSTGIMKTSWLDIGANRYYLDESGAMKVGAFSVGGYYYFAESDGALRRNTTEEENGITIRYDEDGKQWYKNSDTELYMESGGIGWQPVLDQAALLNQRQEIQNTNNIYIEETKDELYENYKHIVSIANNSTDRQNRVDRWKEKVNKKLSEIGVSQAEIDEFIDLAQRARYGGDRGRFTYTYTEEQADGTERTRTYTYTSPDYNPRVDNVDEDDEYDDEY